MELKDIINKNKDYRFELLIRDEENAPFILSPFDLVGWVDDDWNDPDLTLLLTGDSMKDLMEGCRNEFAEMTQAVEKEGTDEVIIRFPHTDFWESKELRKKFNLDKVYITDELYMGKGEIDQHLMWYYHAHAILKLIKK